MVGAGTRNQTHKKSKVEGERANHNSNSSSSGSYYRCTTQRWRVKKMMERSFEDPSVVVTTDGFGGGQVCPQRRVLGESIVASKKRMEWGEEMSCESALKGRALIELTIARDVRFMGDGVFGRGFASGGVSATTTTWKHGKGEGG
ncbi:unnamed protein product [Linum tenue]|uniref:WRKY domain-containing protein n=1 Tax=Linum tenue TaxID=586396 RepID=A0AAV0IV52_9ROSI|nr:unnamed protein product [Linum tenue]